MLMSHSHPPQAEETRPPPVGPVLPSRPVIIRDRAEAGYDSQTIASRKRALGGQQAHTLENVKLKKEWELAANVREDRAFVNYRRRLARLTRDRPATHGGVASGGAPPAPHVEQLQSPLHPDLVAFLQYLWYQERVESITASQAIAAWYSLDAAEKSYVLAQYDRAFAEAQLQATQQQADTSRMQPGDFATQHQVPALATRRNVTHPYTPQALADPGDHSYSPNMMDVYQSAPTPTVAVCQPAPGGHAPNAPAPLPAPGGHAAPNAPALLPAPGGHARTAPAPLPPADGDSTWPSPPCPAGRIRVYTQTHGAAIPTSPWLACVLCSAISGYAQTIAPPHAQVLGWQAPSPPTSDQTTPKATVPDPPAPMAVDPNNALQLKESSTRPSSTTVRQDWSLTSLSSDGDIGLRLLEEIAEIAPATSQNSQDLKMITYDGHGSHGSSVEGPQTGETQVPSTVVAIDKGKRRADAPRMDEDMDSSDEDPATPVPPRRPSYEYNAGDQSGEMNAQVALLLLQQMSGVQTAFREQAQAIKETLEANKQLQELLANHLKHIEEREGMTSRAGSDSPSSSGSVAKTTSTKVADMKVQRRVAKSMGLTLPPTPEEEKLRERVHNHILVLLKCTDTTKLAERFPPLTDEEVESYKNGEGKVVCMPDRFRIDFKHPWKDFNFNAEARAVAIETFRAKAKGGAFNSDPLPDELLTKEAIGHAIDQYVMTLRRVYRKQVNPPTKEKVDASKRAAAKTTRQGTLYRSRRFAIIRWRDLGRHSILFDKLSANNMSGDETDGEKVKHSPVYRIILAEWQSPELRAFLWAIDARYIANWEEPTGSRRSKGNAPRKRVLRPESRAEPGVAPRGLWRNCYNEEWLNKKQEWEIEALVIIPEDYDFTIG
ncbi:hypothetical protein BN946_scf185010.g4 [Trametes cinnabarina]|uniref:Uncharacterized protein n=1 Tax=Pycnoporus cinnabarinus TaxID=5643 RepID=A0A060SS75_PYCCI|nr:hypothetical protein BN946_scf185010.g4 [Trametes cinnabarina]